jgi:hypothetical protein
VDRQRARTDRIDRRVRPSCRGVRCALKSVALSAGIGRTQRNGFTVNDITGNDLDSREATFSKRQLLWTPSSAWEARSSSTANGRATAITRSTISGR